MSKTLVTSNTPPPGARIHRLEVSVALNHSWQEAINLASPNTPSDYNVRKVEDLYLRTGQQVEGKQNLILLNYPSGDGNWDKALAWAQGAGLKNTVPRQVFAIGEQHPKLHKELGCNPMYAVATTECSFDGVRPACCVWWDDSERRVHLLSLDYFSYSDDWFVFGE